MQSALDIPFLYSSHCFLPYHSCWAPPCYGYSVDIKPWTLFHFHHFLLPLFLCCSATSSIFLPLHPSYLSLHRSSCVVYSQSWGFGFSKTGRRVEPFIFNLINSIQSLFTSVPALSCNQHLRCRHKQVLSWTISTILPWQKSLFLLAQRQAGVIWAISLAAHISNCISISTLTSQVMFFHMV